MGGSGGGGGGGGGRVRDVHNHRKDDWKKVLFL